MNIKKSSSNRPLLTIDDPSIYQGEYSPFLRVQNVDTKEDVEQATDVDVLYLVASGTDRVPYVKTPTGAEILPNPFSRGPSLPYPDANNILELNDNLVAIDNHLYALRKELSYWNLYRISYSVDKANDFSNTLSLLGPGEALIINIDGLFTYEGQDYTRGDIILRLIDGTYTTIPASMAGLYFPSELEEIGENSYKLKYSYWTKGSPQDGDWDLKEQGTAKKPYQTETFTITGADAQDSFIYGLRVDFSSIDSYIFKAYLNELNYNEPIPPVIKFFTTNGEEIAVDFTCIYNATGSYDGQANTPIYTLTITSKPASLKYAYIK